MAKDDDTTKAAGAAGKDAEKMEATTAKPGDGQAAQSQAGASQEDAIAILKADHRKVEALFKEFERADGGRKERIIEEACRELIVHTLLEEQIFYPACRKAASKEEPLDEAQVEHDGVKLLIRELMDGERDDEFRQAKFKVMAEEVRHHIGEEEKPGEGVFAMARSGSVDLKGLGDRIKSRKQELMARPDRLRPSRPVSFTELGGEQQSYQETSMPRDRGPDRDERGRFTSDDDDRSGRRYASERYGGGRRDRDDDRGQGGWFGDPRGHSEASRRGWEERRSYADDDRDYRSRGRDYDDDERGYRSRGRERDGGRRGGWFGDSEGHAEAARRGWDDPDHGPSGWYGDSRGHAEAARRGWDNPDHGPSGWYGDPEGHSEASRRGWEERGGGRSRSTRSRYDDDDDERRYRSRGRDDDDDGRGWYGDSRGHSEAARRGWEGRR